MDATETTLSFEMRYFRTGPGDRASARSPASRVTTFEIPGDLIDREEIQAGVADIQLR